jgi:hypothetical protein
MNDVGVMLKADSQQYMGDSGFPSIDVLFSPDSLPNDKHVVDIQFRKRDVGFAKLMALVATAGDCATPDIEWSEATKH